MGILSRALRAVDAVFPPGIARAHCDVPCGIYETDTMTHAAATVAKMVEKLHGLEAPALSAGKQAILDYSNNTVRMVETKENFAQKCKEEALILWTDYFKAEHLKAFPDLHSLVWKVTKLCSQAKRTVDPKVAGELQAAVAELSAIFKKSKEMK